jgi:hypothetical protein
MAADSEADESSTTAGVETDESTDGDEVSVDAAAEPASDGGNTDENGNGDETVPHVELELYELAVRVSGQSTDELEDVEASATRLMGFLIDRAKQLEDQPDTRGLG